MIDYTVINNVTGEVLRYGQCQEECFDDQAGEGETTIRASAPSQPARWDGEQFILRPSRPSAFHSWDGFGWVLDLSRAVDGKLRELNDTCAFVITGGFTSSALGAPYVYDSKLEDQANLTGQRDRAHITGQPQLYKCADAEGVKAWRLHTPAQLDQVFLDGAAYKEAQLVKATNLKNQALAATTIEELEAIQW